MEFKELFESAVGLVGRTGAADAKAHVGAELRAEFKKIVKKLGGKTVARQLLAEMNAGGVITEATIVFKNDSDLESVIADAESEYYDDITNASEDDWYGDGKTIVVDDEYLLDIFTGVADGLGIKYKIK